MSRERTIYDRHGVVAIYQDDELIWRREGEFSNKMSNLPSPMIMRDIEPYKNMINGQMITSRSAHRTLLRDNNCVEVGNDTSHMQKKPVASNQNRKKFMHSMLADVSDKQIQKMVKREIKNRRTH